MQEIAVLGVGAPSVKARVVATLATLARPCVLADCELGSCGLKGLLAARERARHYVSGGRLAVIWENACSGCGRCADICTCDAVRIEGSPQLRRHYMIDAVACEGCGACVEQCPEQAIRFPEREAGVWFVADAACGTMVYGRLDPTATDTGCLVALVRAEARHLASSEERDLVVISGASGSGFSTVAGIEDADHVLVACKPAPRARRDLERTLAMVRRLGLPASIVIVGTDTAAAHPLTSLAADRGVPCLGHLPDADTATGPEYDAVLARVQESSMLQL